MEKAIKRAIAGGYRSNFIYQNPENDQWYWNEVYPVQFSLLDPLFWQALGNSLGWGNSFGFIITSDTGEIDSWLESDSAGTVYRWRYEWHRFIDHLIEGKDAETFFSELLK